MYKIGTIDNPISLEEAQESPDNLQNMYEEARNKDIIQQALFTRQPLDICFAVVKTMIKGDLTVKHRQLSKIIIQYFKEEVGINISFQHFHRRKDPQYSNLEVKPNPCELIIFGVDFLTTNQIKDRFTILDSQIRNIVWINDSTCKLIYGSAGETERVFKDQTKEVKIEQDDPQLPRVWFSIKPYTIFSYERSLSMRYATTEQNVVQKEAISKYEAFGLAKKALGQYLLNKFNAVDKFKNIVSENETRNVSERRSHRSPQRNGSRTREKYRNNQQRHRQFNGPQRDRNKYEPNRVQTQQIHHKVTYAHYPADMDNQGYRNRNQSRGFNSNRMRNQDNQYLDYNKKRSVNKDTSFHYQNDRDKSKINTSFNDNYQNNKKKCYDIGELDSELSFNQFGTPLLKNNRNDQRDDFNFDFDLDKQVNRKARDNNINTQFSYEKERKRNINRGDSSFLMQNSKPSKGNQLNHSFIQNSFEDKKADSNQSFTYNPINKKNKPKDFFDQLNSVVSSVRQVNEDPNENSFQYQKKGDKINKILSESFLMQDSY